MTLVVTIALAMSPTVAMTVRTRKPLASVQGLLMAVYKRMTTTLDNLVFSVLCRKRLKRHPLSKIVLKLTILIVATKALAKPSAKTY